MAKEKTYKVLEDFQYMGNVRRNIEKGAIIPEDFFVKTFGDGADKMKESLIALKKIKLEGVKEDEKVSKSTTNK